MGQPNEIQTFVYFLKSAIQQSQLKAAKAVNTEMVQLYFVLGAAIAKKAEEAQWGDKVLESISNELQKELKGLRGFSAQNLKKMKLFYEAYPEMLGVCPLLEELTGDQNLGVAEIGSTLSNELPASIGSPTENQFNIQKGSPLENELNIPNGSPVENEFTQSFWNIGFASHVIIYSALNSRAEKTFYIRSCAQNGWSKRVLENHIKSKLHEQDGLSNNFDTTITQVEPSKAIAQFRDEYLLDFINIDDADNERVIEDKIVQNIKDFILHMGKGFAFMGNQYRLEVDGDEFFIDLLFYNRHLQAMVVVELKRGKFKPEHLGQLSFYLKVLDQKVRLPHEKPSIGIVLCREKNNSVVEYALQNNQQPMGVATFKTKQELPKDIKNFMPSAAELKKLLK